MFDDYLATVSTGSGVAQPPFQESDYFALRGRQHRDAGVESFLASRRIVLPLRSADDGPESDTVWSRANRKNRNFQHVLVEQGVHAFPRRPRRAASHWSTMTTINATGSVS